MTFRPTIRQTLTAIALAALVLLPFRPVSAYVEAPYTVGRILTESTNVVLMRVEKVDKEKNLIVYHKIRDIKGTHPGETIKHNIGQGGFHPREWQNVMAWAEVGKTALFFHNGSAGETCIDNYWYQSYPGDWWVMSHAEPYLLRSFCGKPDKLVGAVEQMMAGQEVSLPCMVDGDKNAIQLRTAKLQRLKASLKIQDYDPKRDFAGWGMEEFRPIEGMPGFTHFAPIARLDPHAGAIAAADFDGDGKPDLCVYGESKLALLQNGGTSFNEVRLPIEGGARAAVWADFNGDGKPDLFLATPAGPRLFLNASTKEGPKFTDATPLLPLQGYYHLTAAAAADFGVTGKPDLLLADGFGGLKLWRLKVDAGPAVQPAVTLSKWKYIGPFDNTDNKGYDTAYPPEKTLDFAAKYKGKGDYEAVWKEGEFPEAQLASVKLFRDDLHTFMVVYLYREVEANTACEMPISLGNGGPLKVWLNGQQVLAENVTRAPAADQSKLKLSLKTGKNTLLIKACYHASGRSVYFAHTPPAERKLEAMFDDVSDKLGLGARGLGSTLKGDHLIVADVNGDGRPDVLFTAGPGLLLLNTPAGFVEAKNTGLAFQSGGIEPAFGDYDGDGKPDLFVPQRGLGASKLYHNDGAGKFTDVTARSGAVAALPADVTSAAWTDFNHTGRLDLMVGCMKSPNRYLRNAAAGAFVDAGDEIGLYQRIFNTRGVCVLDFNNDGVPDVVFNNEGQEAALLLGSPGRMQAGRAAAGGR